MATYTEFLRVLDREGKPRRFTYVCGREGVLVEEVVDTIRKHLNVDPMNRVTLFAGKDSTGSIWTEMNQYALDPTMTRLVTVRDAQKLEGWQHFEPWILGSKNAPTVHVVMVADEEEWPQIRNTLARERMMKSSQAMYVTCNIGKDKAYEVTTKIVQTWGGVLGKNTDGELVYLFDNETAKHLVERTGGNLARCRDVVEWVRVLGLKEPNPKFVDRLTVLSAQDSFVSALLRVDKVKALQVSPEVVNVGAVIGVLSRRLGELEKLNRAKRVVLGRRSPDKIYGEKVEKEKALKEVAVMSGVSFQVVVELWGAAKHYDTKSVIRRSELLLVADEHKNSEGVLEVLVAQW